MFELDPEGIKSPQLYLHLARAAWAVFALAVTGIGVLVASDRITVASYCLPALEQGPSDCS